MLTGIRAEYDQSYFSNLATEVIIEGIDQDRRNVYEQIVKNGQSKEIDAYPLEAAIKDAVIYHSHCTITAGLQQAAQSIKFYDTPGLDQINKTLMKINQTRHIQQTGIMSPSQLPADAGINSASTSTLTAGTYNGSAPPMSPTGMLVSILQSTDKLSKAVQDKVKPLTTADQKVVAESAVSHTQAFKDAVVKKCGNLAEELDTYIADASVKEALGTESAANTALAHAKGDQFVAQIKTHLASFTSVMDAAVTAAITKNVAAGFETGWDSVASDKISCSKP